ncbi:MAG: RNA-binding transcriptional accessory protein [Bacteroidales bacterium]|nr:RNA-binding transcriptional accessory protein [Bacteroidales bacterium]
MKQLYVKHIAEKLGVKEWQVENCAGLFEDGCTIPFISRYRKEKTGGLDDEQVSSIRHWSDVFEEMEKRKVSILKTIEEAGALTDDLRSQIEGTVDSRELEDLYLPYKPKRKTRASVALAKGLGPLADAFWNNKSRDAKAEAARFVKGEVATVDEALAGARDIVAERFSETAAFRETLRGIFRQRRIVSKVTKAGRESEEGAKYRSYFDFGMPVKKIPAHNLLAMLRAAEEGVLSVGIDADLEKCASKIFYDYCHTEVDGRNRGYPSESVQAEIKEALDDSLKRLMGPSIENEILKEAKEKADIESIEVFAENLRQLLLSPPVGRKRVMAIDPGFRTGCKVVCLDEQGKLLHFEAIFPHPPLSKKIQAISAICEMVEQYGTEVIAVGNGTAGRETMDFLAKCHLPANVRIFSVSEDGASVYSASDVGREEFPEHDVTVRGAVSIGRRLMDPLAELVKIDPKSLGVGQYQHDVDQKLLKEALDNTVMLCVNSVGVNLNTASPYLLQYVSGIGPALASAIVAWRNENGAFDSRQDLRRVPRLGAKAFEQCAGFLRIDGGSNPLDASAVHPESYHIVEKMASDLGVTTGELVGNAELCTKIAPEDYVEKTGAGLPTIRDILTELAKPGRDPREAAEEFEFASDVREIDDLKIGMELPGIVTNITDFGAFVDIGLHENGLIHVSNMKGFAEGRIIPSKVLKLHQKVIVAVISVDPERFRIGLRLVSRK